MRMLASLVGIAVGLTLAAALLTGFSVTAGALIGATLVFWVVHLVVDWFALKVLIRNPSIATAGLVALASTIVSLLVVDVVVSGLTIDGATTYVIATLIIWVTTTIAIAVGRHALRQRRSRP